MSSTHRYADFKDLPIGARRREALRKYLAERRGIATAAAMRAGVSTTMVSKVLNGHNVSANVEQALEEEERQWESTNAA